MKKICLLFVLLLGLGTFSVSAENEVTVLIPDYEFILDKSSIYYQDSIYPILSYKDVTYFPMTYDYCRALHLSTSWVEGQGLFIAAHPQQGHTIPIYETCENPKYNKAFIVPYDVYIDGEKINMEEAEYPLLNFRDVTYFPLTYEYATEKFYWDIDFCEEGNRSLTITPYFHGFGSSMIICKENDSFAIIHNLNDGLYYRIDYKTDEIKSIDGYITPDENSRVVLETSHTLEIKDNRFVLNDVPMAEIQALKNGTTTSDDVQVNYYEYTQNGLRFLDLSAYFHLHIPAPYTPLEKYTYLYHNGQYVPLPCDDSYIKRAENIGENLYFSSVKYTGFRGSTYLHHDLYMMKPDGSTVYVNDMFPDYNSIKLLGQANGKLYVKCEWMPEEYASSLNGNQYSISPYHDGFFTFDGEKLELLRRYTYSDNAVVSPEGDIYITVEQFGKIKKIY